MTEDEFNQLEIHNAQMDVDIDEENYGNLVGSNELEINPTIAALLDKCFPKEIVQHTNNGDWNKLFKSINEQYQGRPVIKAWNISLTDNGDQFSEVWSHLFFAKLIRAKIQQRSSNDCYLHRLDEVIIYLERHLPSITDCKPEIIDLQSRLSVVCLLELSASALDWESLGFSERARRVIRDADRSTAPYKFYLLWAGYNIGVAYFHQRYYRKAVLEFNQIIWQIKKWNSSAENNEQEYLTFFNNHKGHQLLLLPAWLYRAEVQLKLQLAFHSLQSLEKLAKENQDENRQVKSIHKKIRADLMKVQAFQQFGRVKERWAALAESYSGLFMDGDRGGDIKGRLDCIYPEDTSKFPGLAERFLDILIEDHLQWLYLEGEEENGDAEDLRHYVKYGRVAVSDEDPICKRYVYWAKIFQPYLDRLRKAFIVYWKQIEYNAGNRDGFFQQLAKYLSWLAAAATISSNTCPKEELEQASSQIGRIATELYHYKFRRESALRDAILENEPDNDVNNAWRTGPEKCIYCDPKGIDLRRIDEEHFTWFKAAMLDFLKSDFCMRGGKGKEIADDKRYFLRRLGRLERKDRVDLRINDLDLRYKYYETEELLTGNNKKEKRTAAQNLCWQDVRNKDAFQLLKCGRPDSDDGEKDDYDLLSKDYINIMERWHHYFYDHLKKPTIHEKQGGGFYFLGLQRWNSSSPAKGYSVGGGYFLYHLDDRETVDIGIAIDPGFDFVRNLFHSGFGIDDIDILLISHAHLDHIRDFESIVILLAELKKREKRNKRVHVILSLGAYRRLKHIFEDASLRYLVEPYIIDIEREIDEDYFENLGYKQNVEPESSIKFAKSANFGSTTRQIERLKAILPRIDGQVSHAVKIIPTRAFHRDFTFSDSYGFIIELVDRTSQKARMDNSVGDAIKEFPIVFGYTGDTKWIHPEMANREDPFMLGNHNRELSEISSQYIECDVLVVHLGSLIQRNTNNVYSFDDYCQCGNGVSKYPCEELVKSENHPYLVGLLRLLTNLYTSIDDGSSKPLILIGEFGEELRGNIRIDLSRRLQNVYLDKLAILPTDVGINVKLLSRHNADAPNADETKECNCRVWCIQCTDFVKIEETDFKLYGPDHAMYCVCKTCVKSTPFDILIDRLRQLYEVGAEVKVAPENTH